MQIVGRILSIILIFSFLLANAGDEVLPVANLDAANFFLKYYDYYYSDEVPRTPQDFSSLEVSIPHWFMQYCLRRKIVSRNQCRSNTLTYKELEKVFLEFDRSKSNGFLLGVINMALQVARQKPDLAFEILEDAVNMFPDEFRFAEREKNMLEEQKWKKLFDDMPIIEEYPLVMKDQTFYFQHLSDGKYHVIKFKNADGKVIFGDGPRHIMYDRESSRREMTTSLKMTWSDPDYRGYGLYQYAMNFYIEKLEVVRFYLHTENEDTLEFIFRIKQALHKDSTRDQFLKIPGMELFLASMGVDLAKVKEGDVRYIKMAENALSYLSLQGRTRLAINFSFRIDDDNHSIAHSHLLKPNEVISIRTIIGQLEGTLKVAINSGVNENSPISLLPRSYLKKYGVYLNVTNPVSPVESTITPSTSETACQDLIKPPEISN